ncbi:mitochondrial ribosomal protein L1 [Willisornis vidua]|uniref:Mitochondrial ribosomal protein L1 n=1 Tax=Willisornis vidua TaxID=1566151 RepID=A0ABQ9DC76_9PASS|nr:mitochondrial ribosomal protein L1 [Willisornis vidua]
MTKPVDDVYLTWLYRRPVHSPEQALAMLKKFQELDFTHPRQFVYINVFLDMALKKILEGEVQADFYVAVPAIISKLIPLRNKLKQKFPTTRRNSLGTDIPHMVKLFRECHQYAVQDECLIKTRIARLDMPTEHIIANLKTVIHDICTFKPPPYDPIVQKLVIRSSTSEGLKLNLDGILPQVEKVEEEKEEERIADDEGEEEKEEKRVQEPVGT